jgi:hypothetical protein
MVALLNNTDRAVIVALMPQCALSSHLPIPTGWRASKR